MARSYHFVDLLREKREGTTKFKNLGERGGESIPTPPTVSNATVARTA